MINPWIYDFAAYDLWSKPLGLLSLAAYLRECGFHVSVIDCLDNHHPSIVTAPKNNAPKRRTFGTGKFLRTQVPRPGPLNHVPRSYGRYGISRRSFRNELEGVSRPSAFLITSVMTYWYPGVKEVISMVKNKFPDVPVILGGIYARLCAEHAAVNSGADRIVTGSDPRSVVAALADFGVSCPGASPPCAPFPAFDLLYGLDYVCLLTSRGCPYRCRYCASPFLDPKRSRRDPEAVFEEILYWHRTRGIKDFAFYDDALLVDADVHLAVFLEKLASLDLGLRFHTPNALHIREITRDLAALMFRTGFTTIRLGLETLDFSFRRHLDNKVSEGDFESALVYLNRAGFGPKQIGVYLLIGLPDQSVDSIHETMNYVADLGAMPYLAEYSPIPHTTLWEKAVDSSAYDLTREPLYHNNTLLPCWGESKKRALPKLRQRVREIRHSTD